MRVVGLCRTDGLQKSGLLRVGIQGVALSFRRRLITVSAVLMSTLLFSFSYVVSANNYLPVIQTYLLDDGRQITGVVVQNDAELIAAIAGGIESTINLAPGVYTTKDLVEGLDRQANPLTIIGLDPDNKPVFEDATQSLQRAHYITFKDIKFVSTGTPLDKQTWFYDGGGRGTGRGADHIVLEGLEFYSPAPSSLTSTTPTPNYADQLFRLFQLSNFETHTYTIKNIVAKYAYSVGDFTMNGDVLLDNIVVDKWYFDGIRILGQGTEGYVDGNRVIAHVDLTDNIAVYNEINGTDSPHPDSTQKFNSGNAVNNTAPRVQNTLFYQNRFNPGQLRSNNTQAGLSQSYELNVGYVENIYGTKASPHGISLEGGANGVLIERNSLVDVNWGSSPWVRIFRSDGQVAVYDNYIKGGFNTAALGPNMNLPGYELNESGNSIDEAYADFFNGPGSQIGVDALMAMFSPIQVNSAGALTHTGRWKNQPHRPMMAIAPELFSTGGSFTLKKVHTPTLWSTKQASFNAEICTSFNLRWAPQSSGIWTEETDVNNGFSVSPVPLGLVDIQTQCVNTAGDGLWSKPATLNIAL